MGKSVGFIGSISGKIGNLVFAYLKGQQTVRAYQPNPLNPQSEDQVTQRSKFDSAGQYAIALNRHELLKDMWKRNTLNPLSPYNRMLQENLLEGSFQCTGDDINILPANCHIPMLPFGAVNGGTFEATTCSNGDYTFVSFTPATGCGEVADGVLLVCAYNSNLLTDPDQAPFRDVRICVDYYLHNEVPASLDTAYPIFDGCCPSCPDLATECCAYAWFLIPLKMINIGSSGVLPDDSDIEFIGEPIVLCQPAV